MTARSRSSAAEGTIARSLPPSCALLGEWRGMSEVGWWPGAVRSMGVSPSTDTGQTRELTNSADGFAKHVLICMTIASS